MILNREQIRTRVRHLIGDAVPNSSGIISSESAIFGADALNRFISDALREIARFLHFLEGETLISTVADQAAYNAPDYMMIDHIDWDDKPLEFKTSDQVYLLDEKWETRTGEPIFAILNHSNEWGLIGTSDTETRKFILYPAPVATVTDDIRVIGRLYLLDLDSDVDAPALPSWLHEVVQYEAAALVLEASGDQRNEALAQAYRGIRDWYLKQGQDKAVNRYPSQARVKARTTRVPNILFRDVHVPFTGIAPGTAE